MPPPSARLCRPGCLGWLLRWTRGSCAAFSAPAHASSPAASASPPLWLVVGLGNVGFPFRNTRHNVGFAVVEALASRHRIPLANAQHRALTGRGAVGSTPVLLAQPSTLMNASGESVASLCRFYKVPPSRLIIAYDDLDTEVATLRLRKAGGHGGHNGVRSVLSLLPAAVAALPSGSGGAAEFIRVRIGIGRPPPGRDVAGYVLSRFDPGREAEDISIAVERAADAIEDVLLRGVDAAMNAANARGGKEAAVKAPRPRGAAPGQPAAAARGRPSAVAEA